MKLITVPDPILNTPAKPVKKIDKKICRLVEEMKLILKAQTDPPGVGLAAPQVGVPLRIFITKPTKKSPISVFVNPDIVGVNPEIANREKTESVNDEPEIPKNSKSKKLEGCLSIPRVWGPVKRSPRVALKYQTLDGKIRQDSFEGFEATIIQHELDHLNGILFTRRSLEQGADLFEQKGGELIKTEID